MPIPKFTGKYCKNNCFFLTMDGQCVLYPSETYITHQIGLNNKRLREHACVIKYKMKPQNQHRKVEYKFIMIEETTTSEITKHWIVRYKWRHAGIGSIYYCRSNQRYCFFPITIGNNPINSNILRELADFLNAADKGLKVKKGIK